MIPNRIFVEVSVIVGSILLAFAIDAAWDTRKSNLLEHDIIASISREMEVNLADISQTIGDLRALRKRRDSSYL